MIFSYLFTCFFSDCFVSFLLPLLGSFRSFSASDLNVVAAAIDLGKAAAVTRAAAAASRLSRMLAELDADLDDLADDAATCAPRQRE